MIALIDIGNSRVKLGWLDAATGAREAAPLALENTGDANNGAATAARIADWFTNLPTPPTHALGVSVATPARTGQVDAAFAALGCAVAWQPAAPAALGLTNGYTDPAQLGADRWAALLGLVAQWPSAPLSTNHEPALLASFGTATTLDTVSPERVFVGGLILPGPDTMYAALAGHTARLPRVADSAAGVNVNFDADFDADALDYPCNTQTAIVAGVAAAQAGALLRQWTLGWQRYGAAPTVSVTGGGWPLVAHAVRHTLHDTAHALGLAAPTVHERGHLVLDGLAALALQDNAEPRG